MTKLEDFVVLVYGAKKIGKTSMMAEVPDNLIIAAEPGTKAVSAYTQTVRNWGQCNQVLKLLRDDTTFASVTVDTVTRAYAHCDKRVCADMNISHASEADYGKAWSRINSEFSSWLTELCSLGKGVFLIAHSTVRDMKKRGGGEYTVIQPDMPKGARSTIEPMVDVIAYYDYEGSDRYLTIVGDEEITAGHRLKGHFQWKGEPVRRIFMGRSEAESWHNFYEAFHNRYDPNTPITVTPAPKKKSMVLAKK